MDSLAQTLHSTAAPESQLEIENALRELSHAITYLSDLRDWETQQIEAKVIGEISQYDQVGFALNKN